MAIKFQDSLEVKGGSASKIYLEGAGGTGSSTILQAHNPDDGAGHGGGTAYLKSSGWGEAQLAVGSYRWTQAGGKMTVTGGVYYFNTGNVGIGTGNPAQKLDVNGAIAIGGSTFVDSNKSNIYLNSSNSSGGQGIFFRSGFTYNASITTEDHNGNFADGICISGYDGVSFSTGSNERQERMRVAQNGNVGIGVTNPTRKLHISAGSGYAALFDSTNRYKIGLANSGVEEWWIASNSDGSFAIHENAVGDQLTISAGGNLTVNGSVSATGGNSGQWNTAYGWGNHADEGYLTSLPSHNHSAEDITSGTLNADRLPWAENDGFGGTYPIVWRATNTPYTSSWLNVNGTTDTLHSRNIHAQGKITSTDSITVNNTTSICVAHWSRTNNSTGAIKIKLPGLHSSSNWSMVVLRITTYEYNSNEHTIYYVSGHDWVSGWYNRKVTIIGETDKLIQVAYSDDADEDYVIIGDEGSVWAYGHVTVDVMAHPSFYHSSMDITEGWTIEQTEDLAGINLQPTETKRVANEQWVTSQGYLTSFDITTQTDPKYLRSDTSDTMSGNLLVSSQTQTNATSKAEMLSNAVAKFKPHAQNSGYLAIAQVDDGNAVGMQFTNGAGTADWDIALQPFGGRVGIGTATPAALLDVDGTAQMSTGITENTHYVGVSVQHWGDGGTGMYFNTDSVDIRTNAVTRIEFNNSGVSIPSDIYFTGNSRKIYLTGGDTNSQNGWVVGEQDRYGFGATWDSGTSILFQGWDGRDVTTSHNVDLGSVDIRDRVWNFLGSARLNNNDLATEAWVEEQPPAPAAASCAVVGDTIEVSFDPAPESPDYYQVWASQDGGSYSLIAQIPTQDFAPFMTVIDTSFSVSGLRAYRVYAVRRGIYSDPATTSRTYTQSALEPVNMDVVPMEESFFVQWDSPQSRFVDHYEVYLDTHADQGSLNRNNASLVYSGNNTFYMHRASTNEFHQFWVEIAES